VLSFLPPAFVADNSNERSKPELVNELQKDCQKRQNAPGVLGKPFTKSRSEPRKLANQAESASGAEKTFLRKCSWEIFLGGCPPVSGGVSAATSVRALVALA
jgi:hypothetical protein